MTICPRPSAGRVVVRWRVAIGMMVVVALAAPRLAGQSYEYLVESMRRFAEGERKNNAIMTKMMAAMAATDRQAMARYLSGL